MKQAVLYKWLSALLAMVCLISNPALADTDGSISAVAGPYMKAIGMDSDAAVKELGLNGCSRDSDSNILLATSAALADAEFAQTLLIDRQHDTVYGLRFTSSLLSDPTAARNLAGTLTAMLTAEYGQPDTYPTEYLAPSTLDEDAAAALSVCEYWNFALPRHMRCEVRVYGVDDEYDEYLVTLNYALSVLPGVDYALGDETAPYIALIGKPRADVSAALGRELNDSDEPGLTALGEVEILGKSARRVLMFDLSDDTLYGVRYRFDAPDAKTAAGIAAQLFMQATQELGPDDTYPGLENRLAPGTLADDMAGGPCSYRADWRLHTADMSLPGLTLELTAEADAEGKAFVTAQFGLVSMPEAA